MEEMSQEEYLIYVVKRLAEECEKVGIELWLEEKVDNQFDLTPTDEDRTDEFMEIYRSITEPNREAMN